MITELLAYAAWKRRRATYAQEFNGDNMSGIQSELAVSANPVVSYSPNDRKTRTVECRYPATSYYAGPPFPPEHKRIPVISEARHVASEIISDL